MTLAGRSVIVTGGGSGIGAACAARLVAEGAVVTICGRTAARLTATAARLAGTGPGGGTVRPVVADVTDEDDVRDLVQGTVAAVGALDGVVANAGGAGPLAPYHRQPVTEFVRVLQLNVLAGMLLIKHAVPPMAAAGGGSFVAVSSIAAHLTHRYVGAYAVAKAGVEAMVRNAADEYGEVGLRFNAVRPGFTDTEVMAHIPRDSEVYGSYVRNTPLAGVGHAADVANLVTFLLGDGARWITGQTVGVDGGHGLRRGPDLSSVVDRRLPGPAVSARRGGNGGRGD